MQEREREKILLKVIFLYACFTFPEEFLVHICYTILDRY